MSSARGKLPWSLLLVMLSGGTTLVLRRSAYFDVITTNPQQNQNQSANRLSQFFTQESIPIPTPTPTPRKQLSNSAGGENGSLGVRCEY